MADFSLSQSNQILASSAGRIFTVDEVGFFEGTEKLLEIWFEFYAPDESGSDGCRKDDHVGIQGGLRTLPRLFLEELLELAGCRILSEIHNQHIDSYLLSESSLFVSSHRFILKTCGTTSILNAVQPLIRAVKNKFPHSEVKNVFYSHCPFMRPDLQFHPYCKFSDESSYLDEIFENGSAYVLGRINGSCWYLYVVNSIESPLSHPDQTLEIMMTYMDPHFMGQFSKLVYKSASELTKTVGLDCLLPGSILDAHIFEPCGYSLNAIVKEDKYFTIHVTPQVECAYVSFETNVNEISYKELINKVLRIFKPGQFTLTFFANKICTNSSLLPYHSDSILTVEHNNSDDIYTYTCQDRQTSSFSFYDLTFLHYKHNNCLLLE